MKNTVRQNTIFILMY